MKFNLYRVYTYRDNKCSQCYINAKSVIDAKDKTWWLPEDDRDGKQAFRIFKPAEIAIIGAAALEESNKVYTRYLNGNDKSLKDYIIMDFPKKDISVEIIVKLMNDCYKVKCGYFPTKIRGYHNRVILYK